MTTATIAYWKIGVSQTYLNSERISVVDFEKWMQTQGATLVKSGNFRLRPAQKYSFPSDWTVKKRFEDLNFELLEIFDGDGKRRLIHVRTRDCEVTVLQDQERLIWHDNPTVIIGTAFAWLGEKKVSPAEFLKWKNDRHLRSGKEILLTQHHIAGEILPLPKGWGIRTLIEPPLRVIEVLNAEGKRQILAFEGLKSAFSYFPPRSGQ